MTIAALLVAALVVSVVGTGLLRRYALFRSILDIPNDRSSHTSPTPRGGGVAIVVAFGAGTIALAMIGAVPPSTAYALVGAGLIAAVTGFLDDHRSVTPAWRLVAHFAAAAWALTWLGGLPPLQLVGRAVDLGLIGDLLATVGLVWLLNLYNFMDGIDGIAGVEALTVCFGAMLLYTSRPDTGGEWALPGLLALASLGFLAWNFPPARIFMGDAGSGFIGLMLGVLTVRAAMVNPSWLWSWMILLGVFIVDATVTLVRRLVRRKRLDQAHRSHAYQHAAARLGAHRPVTIAVGAINLFWLAPLALAVGTSHLNGMLGIVIAYVPLVWLALRFNAGVATLGRQR